MPDITDPTALGFVNDKVRPLADNIARLYYVGKQIIDEYNARGGTNFISASANDEIKDGADGDSRPVLTGADVTRLGSIMIEIINLLEADRAPTDVTDDAPKLSYINAVANRVIMPPRFQVSEDS